MSRALKSGEFCSLTPQFAADLLVGIDGVAIVTSKSSSCSTSTVNQVGKAVPVQARRRYDVFGDDEAVAVTFRYGEAEHGVVVQVDLTLVPEPKDGSIASLRSPLYIRGPFAKPKVSVDVKRIETPRVLFAREPVREPAIVEIATDDHRLRLALDALGNLGPAQCEDPRCVASR